MLCVCCVCAVRVLYVCCVCVCPILQASVGQSPILALSGYSDFGLNVGLNVGLRLAVGQSHPLRVPVFLQGPDAPHSHAVECFAIRRLARIEIFALFINVIM